MIEGGKDNPGIKHLVNRLLPYGGIFVKDSVATIALNSANPDVIITQWTTNSTARNCTPDVSNNVITITEKGIYLVSASFATNITVGGTVSLFISGYLNGIIQPQLHAHRSISGTEVRSSFLVGFIDVTSTVPVDLDFRANLVSGTKNLVVEDASAIIKSVS